MPGQPEGAPATPSGGGAADDTPDGHPSRSQSRDAAHNAALDAMAELLREDARSWARQLRTLADLAVLSELGAKAGVAQFPQLEMAGSWSVSQLTATRWQDEAERFHTALPATLALLETGGLFRHQAAVLLHRTRNCTESIAQAVEAEVLERASTLCPADLGRRVDRAVLRIEAEQVSAQAAEQRHVDAAAERRTFTRTGLDGMGLAGAVLTAEQLAGWSAGMERLERRERHADRHAGIDRTADQRRADLFAALPALVLAGTAQDNGAQDNGAQGNAARDGSPGGASPDSPTRERTAHDATDREAAHRPWTFGPEQIAAQIVLHVHVPVSTVLDLSQVPGSIDRYGPVSAAHVRLLRPTAYRRVLVDGVTGEPVALDDHATPVAEDPQDDRGQIQAMLRPEVVTDLDEPQHDPSARLARLVDLRGVRCCGPGCSATRCDRDHLEPWPAGPTSARNLGLASPRCHRAKHHGWTLVRHLDGSATWTSPLGRTYDRPSPHDPPPPVDLYREPPPRRAAPAATTPVRWVTPQANQRDAAPVEPDGGHGVPVAPDVASADPPPF